ncbi:MAG: RidA family protein [Pseudomonadota bacterium]
MTGTVAARLAEKNIVLPEPVKPLASYVPWVKTGNLLFVSGQVPFKDGGLSHTGRVGEDISVDEGQACARICGLNILSQVNDALDGDLDRVVRVVKLTGFVSCGAGFSDQPKVINGCSDLMAEVFGDAGRHARAAVGAPSLPLNSSVEVEAIFEVR